MLLVSNFFCMAQMNEITKLPEIQPKNPQAFQFTKFGEIPVGKYSGTLDFSIPIYTIKANGIEIPITLSYQSNGIKVIEEAGWAGLGWDISAGGSIVQNVIGTDDYGRYKRRLYPDLNCMLDYQNPVSQGTVWGANTTFFLNQDRPNDMRAFVGCNFTHEYATGEFDTSPDRFTFSFLNYSGEFHIDWETGKFECTTDKNIIIYSEENNQYTLPQRLVINVPEGHRFIFELKEETQAVLNFSQSETTGLGSSIDITNIEEKTSRVYRLVKIFTNKRDLINFNYEISPISKNFPLVNLSYTSYVRSLVQEDFGFPFSDGQITSRQVTQQPYSFLSSISFTGGSVQFLTSGRIDLKEARKLDKIEVKDRSDTVIKSFNFNYSYFVGHQLGTNWDNYLNVDTYTSGKTANELTHRLRLDSFQEKGLNPYQFTYNAEVLPKKTSYSIDYWGFYSGYMQNSSFFPNIYRFNMHRENTVFHKHSDNNKSPNQQYCKAGILEKVKYPTGGDSQFFWELNTFDNMKIPSATQGATLKYVNLTTIPGSTNQRDAVVLIEGGNTIFKGSATLSTRGCTNPEAYSSCKVKIQLFKKELMSYVQNHTGYQYGIKYVLAVSGLLDGSNTTLYNQYIQDVIYLNKLYDDPAEKLYSNLTYNLPEGVAVFSVYGGCGIYNGTTNSAQAGIVLSYRDYKPLTGISYGAGLRIKSTISTTSTGNVGSDALRKDYTYYGGKLMSPLVFFNRSAMNYYWSNDYGGVNIAYLMAFIGTKNVLSSSSFVSPSLDATGRYVGYDQVDEMQVSQSYRGETYKGTVSDYYHNTPIMAAATGAGNYTSISIPSPSPFPANGQQKKQETTDQEQRIIERTSYSYKKKINNVDWGVKIATTGNIWDMISGIVVFYPTYLIGVYPIISQKSLMSDMTAEKYFYGPGNASSVITSIKNMTYDAYDQLSYEKTYESNSDLLEKFYKYPYSYDNSDLNFSVLNQMKSNNVISTPVEEIMKVNSENVFAQRREYSLKTGGNLYEYPDIFTARRIKNYKTQADSGYQTDFNAYDSKCNPLEIVANGKTYSYIWGYGETLPVAVMENTVYATIAPALISDIKSKSNSGTESQLIIALQNLRNSLPNAMVTTYTYKPLVGISTVTDPKGLRTTYEYDSFGRLKFVKDNDGKVLSQNQYHYRTQN